MHTSERDYPVLFGTTRVTWAPIDVQFKLLTREVDDRLVARVYIVPLVRDQCVVVGFRSGDWGPAGGGLEPGETVLAALARELREEAGARLVSYTPFGVLRCHSHGPPYRPHLPHPDYDCLYGYGDVDLVGTPTAPLGEDSAMTMEMMPAKHAVAFLGDRGRAWEADLYRLAAELRSGRSPT